MRKCNDYPEREYAQASGSARLCESRRRDSLNCMETYSSRKAVTD